MSFEHIKLACTTCPLQQPQDPRLLIQLQGLQVQLPSLSSSFDAEKTVSYRIAGTAVREWREQLTMGILTFVPISLAERSPPSSRIPASLFGFGYRKPFSAGLKPVPQRNGLGESGIGGGGGAPGGVGVGGRGEMGGGLLGHGGLGGGVGFDILDIYMVDVLQMIFACFVWMMARKERTEDSEIEGIYIHNGAACQRTCKRASNTFFVRKTGKDNEKDHESIKDQEQRCYTSTGPINSRFR